MLLKRIKGVLPANLAEYIPVLGQSHSFLFPLSSDRRALRFHSMPVSKE
jgi:hypothetical protein